MVRPTANKTPRPRYAIVRKRLYVPPRDELDTSDVFFEPVFSYTEEKLRAQAFYKQFSGLYYSARPVTEKQLSCPAVVLALAHCIGIVVCILSSRRLRAFGE